MHLDQLYAHHQVVLWPMLQAAPILVRQMSEVVAFDLFFTGRLR